jgi:uncharacterized RDD family membrane protein YckC
MNEEQHSKAKPYVASPLVPLQYYSGFGRRLSALLIDVVIVLPILRYFGLFGAPEGYELGFQLQPLGMMYILLYYIVLEGSPLRASLGKLATSQVVTDEFGEKISIIHTVGRNLAKLLTLMSIMLGFFTILFTKRNQALHDLSSRTCVMTRRET